MRDFRDAKVMAHTLRSALATKGLNITVSQSLELIAEAFGVADWNTLSAAIRREAAGPHNDPRSPQFPGTATQRALAYATQRKHQYETLEHPRILMVLPQGLMRCLVAYPTISHSDGSESQTHASLTNHSCLARQCGQ